MGPRKIEIKMVEDKSARQVTFSKRRQGLFAKANERAIMCGAEVAIIAFSPGGKPFSFGNPSVESVTNRFLDEDSDEKSSGNCCDRSSSSKNRKINKLNDQYEDLMKQLQIEQKNGEMLEKALNQYNLKKCKLPIDELEKLKSSLEELRDAVKLQVSEIEASSSLLLLAGKPVKAKKNRG